MANWEHYWLVDHQANPASHHESVGRILNGVPIENEVWLKTVIKVANLLELDENSTFLDLCGGNGLLSSQLPITPQTVVCADLNWDLLLQIESMKILRIQTDMRSSPFKDSSFSAIAIYAALQYLTEAETYQVFEEMFRLLNDGGRAYLGDIPDRNARVAYFSQNNRINRYFDSIKTGRAMIGTWFDTDWLLFALTHVGFSKVTIIQQDNWEPYANFRFDILLEK